MLTLPVPLTVIALRFLEPITAPTPDLPAALSSSFIIAAILLRFSPPGPIVRTLVPLVASLVGSFVVSDTYLPHTLEASFNSTLSSSIERYTGFSDFPSNITASNPADFNSAPQKPPEFEDAMVPESGDLVTTIYLPPVNAGLPVKGPVITISLLSGLNASTLGSTSSIIIFVPNPLPPINFLANSSFSSSTLIFPSFKFTLKYFPLYPYIQKPPFIFYNI